MKNESNNNRETKAMPHDAMLGNVIDLFKEFKKVTHLTVMRRFKYTYREAIDACEELEKQGKIIYKFRKGGYYVA